MIVKNNYNECLTNLACSIRKYFELEYHHNTLDYVDKILETSKPKKISIHWYRTMLHSFCLWCCRKIGQSRLSDKKTDLRQNT